MMSSYDDIIKKTTETERMLAQFKDYEHTLSHSAYHYLTNILEQERLLKSALPEYSNQYLNMINSIQANHDVLRDFEKHSAAMAHLTDANFKMAELFTKQPDIEHIARLTVAVDPYWLESLKAYDQYSEKTAAEMVLTSHYTAVAEASILAQQRLLHVPWESLGSAVSMAHLKFDGIKERFTTLTDIYQSLVVSFEDREHQIASFPPIVSAGPPIEILLSAKLVDTLSRSVLEDEYEVINCQAEAVIEDEIESDINELLGALNPSLRTVWLGAKTALRSNNPDRGRHVVVSLRELVTHVLHALAPDEDIQSWTQDPSYYHEGRPNRKSRVFYICREINHGPLSKFMDADVRANIAFIDLFQQGTHSLDTPFSDEQLRALIIRTESLLRFLLLTSRNK